MPNYNLSGGIELLSEATLRDQAEALSVFGKQISKKLTLLDQGCPAPYFLDEWIVGPHWVKPTIPVWVSPNL